jgi:CBS domain-containing protein
MQIRDVMTREVATAAPTTSLKDAACTLVRLGISGLPVVDGGRVVGVLSESDIVEKEEGPTGHLHPAVLEARTAADAMSAPPITAEPWEPIYAAAWKMIEHDVNRLPVVWSGRLVGIITRADIVRAFARADADIAREIEENVLPSLGLSAADVAVNVERGEVTLSGELEREDDGSGLSRAVQYVPGVVRVRVETPAGVV